LEQIINALYIKKDMHAALDPGTKLFCPLCHMQLSHINHWECCTKLNMLKDAHHEEIVHEIIQLIKAKFNARPCMKDKSYNPQDKYKDCGNK
jgi:hypothetical protein